MQISKVYTHYAATALFFFFGLRSLYDAFFKKDDVGFLLLGLGSGEVLLVGNRRGIFFCDAAAPLMLG